MTTPHRKHCPSSSAPLTVPLSPPLAVQDYVTLELSKELKGAGFKEVVTQANSPRHRTVVATVDK